MTILVRCHQLIFSDDGADVAEYALVLVLISVVAIAAMTLLEQEITNVFCTVVSAFGGSC